MMEAPKIMLLIYSHDNLNKYRDHSNAVVQSNLFRYKTLFSYLVTNIGHAFSQAMNKSLYAVTRKSGFSRANPFLNKHSYHHF